MIIDGKKNLFYMLIFFVSQQHLEIRVKTAHIRIWGLLFESKVSSLIP